MSSELIQVSFDKILQTRTYTVIVLNTPAKRFAIYTDPMIGRILHMLLTHVKKPRPLTHDLMKTLFDSTNMRVLQVVLLDLEDTIYFARLFLEQDFGKTRHIVELDTRPSDGITLALMHHAPVFCTQSVLEKTVPIDTA